MSLATPVEYVGGDGVRLAGSWRGDRASGGPPVVLSHGGGQTRHAWGATAERLAAAGFAVLSLDLRGHGESGWAPPGADYRMEHYAQDLRIVAQTLPRPPILVGASLGGLASLIAAGEAPQTPIAGLCLVDVSPRLRPEGVAGVLGFMRATRDGFATLDEAADAIAAYLPHRPRRPAGSSLAKNLRLGDNGRLLWRWDPRTVDRPLDPAEMNARCDAAASQVSAPALLLRGELSELVSHDVAAEFMARFADGRLQEIAGARHIVAGDRNDAFGAALLAFAREVRGDAPFPVPQVA